MAVEPSPQFKMPERGTVAGDPNLPLYRVLDLPEDIDSPEKAIEHATSDRRLGSHFSHDLSMLEDWSAYGSRNRFAFEVEHPGTENVLSWDNPSHKRILEDLVIGEKYKDAANPSEVPVMPNTPLKVVAVHHGDSLENRTPIKPRIVKA
jgi:hypothetical protein